MNDSFPIEDGMVPQKVAKRNVKRTRTTRASQTREATSHEAQVDMTHFDRVFEMAARGKTYMPPEATPEGFVGMWVRESVYGNSDYNNVHNRMRFGWMPPEASHYPKVGFRDFYGEYYEDSGLLRRGGLVWMLRPKVLHDRELEVMNRKNNNANHFNDSARNIGVEGAFVTGRGTGSQRGQTVTFSQDPKAQHIAGLFNR